MILGHNQFMGTNHLSAAKGNATDRRFSNIDNVREVFEYAVANGITGFMLSTHDRAPAIIRVVKESKHLSRSLAVYPLLPYITKYVKGANEKGMLNVVKDSIESAGVAEKIKILFRGGVGALRKDLFSIIETLIRVELLPFTGLNIRAVFLHDVLTDLALAYDLKEIFTFYEKQIKKRYSAIPAYATKNLPLLLSSFTRYNIKRPLVMASINKVGFQTNPSLREFEMSLNEGKLDFVAMSTLASGALKPSEAYEYIATLPNISSVVVGFSTKVHADETCSEIKRWLGWDESLN